MDILQGDGLWHSDHWADRASGSGQRPARGGDGRGASRDALDDVSLVHPRLERLCAILIRAAVSVPFLMGAAALIRSYL